MFKIIYKNTRPDSNTWFFVRTPEVTAILKRYRDSGMLLKEETVYSPDNLIRTYSMWWSERQGLQQFNSEPEVKAFVTSKTWYDTQNNIYSNIITKTVEDTDE